MTDVYLVYSDLNDRKRIEEIESNKGLFIHFIDDQTLEGKKKAYKLKGEFAARKSPFCVVYNKNEVEHVFYSEAHDVINELIKLL